MTSTSTTSFNYKPLNGLGRIRLVLLEPSENKSARVECRLIHGWITSPLLYDALSYCWGNEVATRSILIDGSEFMIRDNLFSALRRLRLAKATRLIWIDAICINQTDIDERNSQVSQMRLIYSNADNVIVWLGEDAEGAEVAIQFIPDLITMLEDNDLAQREERSLKLLTGYECVTLLGMLARLFMRPWWNRVWIVQEVSAATKPPILHCGSQTFSWKVLRQLLEAIVKSRAYDLLLQPRNLPNTDQAVAALHVLQWTIKPLSALVLIRNSMVDTRRNLSGLLWLTGSFDASDPKDKVFALIGLTNPLFRVPIDYKHGPDWVNLSTTIEILREDKDLRSLGWRNEVDESGKNQFPSWMNQFTKPASSQHMVSTRVSHWTSATMYSADGNEDSVFKEGFLLQNNERVLVLEGIKFDQVSELGDDPYAPDTDGRKTLSSVFHQWKQISEAPSAHQIQNVEAQKSTFWRTLFRDRKLFEFRNEHFYEIHRPKRVGDDMSSLYPKNALEEQKLVTAFDEIGWHSQHRFFLSANGRTGLASLKARVGDLVCVLFGAEVPFLLRPLGEINYQLIGEWYAHKSLISNG